MALIITLAIFILILMLCSHESNTGDARRKRERDEYFKEADAAALRVALEEGILAEKEKVLVDAKVQLNAENYGYDAYLRDEWLTKVIQRQLEK